MAPNGENMVNTGDESLEKREDVEGTLDVFHPSALRCSDVRAMMRRAPRG